MKSSCSARRPSVSQTLPETALILSVSLLVSPALVILPRLHLLYISFHIDLRCLQVFCSFCVCISTFPLLRFSISTNLTLLIFNHHYFCHCGRLFSHTLLCSPSCAITWCFFQFCSIFSAVLLFILYRFKWNVLFLDSGTNQRTVALFPLFKVEISSPWLQGDCDDVFVEEQPSRYRHQVQEQPRRT